MQRQGRYDAKDDVARTILALHKRQIPSRPTFVSKVLFSVFVKVVINLHSVLGH